MKETTDKVYAERLTELREADAMRKAYSAGYEQGRLDMLEELCLHADSEKN